MASDLLGIGISGLNASQRGLATTGHNIANANTPGFSRQRTELIARPPQGFGDGFIGTGVEVNTVARIFNTFLVDQVRTTTASASQLDRFHSLSQQVDRLLANPSSGLTPSLSGFFSAIHQLADDPSSIPARQVLLGEADTLVNRFHSLDQQLRDIRRNTDGELRAIVAEINTLSGQVGELNKRIGLVQANAAGNAPNDLLDQRDEIIRQLSARIGVSVFADGGGNINVTIGGGQALVVGTTVASLEVVPNGFDPTRSEIAYTVSGTTAIISDLLDGGELTGVLGFRREVLDPAQDALGRVAMGVAAQTNTQHHLGVDLDGLLGGDFFNTLPTASPTVLSNSANTGSAAISASITDVGLVADTEYRLDRSGANHTLTRLVDNTVFTLTTFPGGAQTVDGITLSLASGAIADGDSFLIQPVRNAARDIAVLVNHPRAIAAGAPVRTAASLANTGSGLISAGVVSSPDNVVSVNFTSATTFDVIDGTSGDTLATGVTFVAGGPIAFNGWSVSISGAPNNGDSFAIDHSVTAVNPANTGSGIITTATVSPPDPNLTDPVTITFGAPPNTFTVTGATVGSPTVSVPYTSGDPISFNGWTVEISGVPTAGDTFTVGPNTNGVGDNRNAVLLANLQNTTTLESRRATFGEAYGRLVAQVGTTTQRSGANATAQSVLLEQVVEQRDSVSGVNLDEEAANLLRLQQSYEASARVIAIANEIFNTLISTVGGR